MKSTSNKEMIWMPKIITIYEVTREYGGPEEGGWWYDHWEWQKSYIFKTERQVERNLERLERLFEDHPNIRVVLEDEVGEFETKERPIYC
jgi:hypothetical protein